MIDVELLLSGWDWGIERTWIFEFVLFDGLSAENCGYYDWFRSVSLCTSTETNELSLDLLAKIP